MDDKVVAKNLLLDRNCNSCIFSDKSYVDLPDDIPSMTTFEYEMRCNNRLYIYIYPADVVFEIYPKSFIGDSGLNRTELTVPCPEPRTCNFWEGL